MLVRQGSAPVFGLTAEARGNGGNDATDEEQHEGERKEFEQLHVGQVTAPFPSARHSGTLFLMTTSALQLLLR
jgi:hypothetical protein